ncbi:MAG: sensor histidine kinase [Vicinamibacterales bacterium]
MCLTLDGPAGPVTGQQTEFLSLARESCDQMRRCLDDLVDASRLETGKMSLKKAPASLADIVCVAVRSVQPNYEERHVRIRQRIAQGLPDIDVDRQRIVQVVTNLLNNAAKFTRPGGSVAITLDEEIGGQRISVSDAGPASPPPAAADLRPSGPDPDRRRGHRAGHGAGAVPVPGVRRAARRRARAGDTPGRRSTFRFVLPAEENTGQPAVENVDADVDSGAGS